MVCMLICMDSVFRNYTSATFLVVSDRRRGVLKASWTAPSCGLDRRNCLIRTLRLGQRTVCRRTWRSEEGLDQTKARSVADVRVDMVRNSEHCVFGSLHPLHSTLPSPVAQ